METFQWISGEKNNKKVRAGQKSTSGSEFAVVHKGSGFVQMKNVTERRCSVFVDITALVGTFTWIYTTVLPEVFLKGHYCFRKWCCFSWSVPRAHRTIKVEKDQ